MTDAAERDRDASFLMLLDGFVLGATDEHEVYDRLLERIAELRSAQTAGPAREGDAHLSSGEKVDSGVAGKFPSTATADACTSGTEGGDGTA